MTKTRIALTSTIAAMAIVALTAQSQWYALYDEAVKHIQAGEFQQAETKLLQAKKDGPASGRNVLRYGSLRQPYFPDYYLGVVYVSTNRPQEALDAFTAARQANIDAKNNEFKLIGTFEGQAKTALANARNNPPPPPNPGGKPGTATPANTGPDPAVARAAGLKEFDGLLATARQQLDKKNYDGAEQSANNARALSDKQGLGVGQRADQMLKDIAGTKQVAAVEDAVNRKDPAAARAAWNLLNAMAPTYADPTLRARIERMERDAAPPNIPVAPSGNASATAIAQVENLLKDARAQLAQRNFDGARTTADSAKRLAIQSRLDAQYEQRADTLVRDAITGRSVAVIETAIKNRDVAAGRKELTTLSVNNPQYDARALASGLDRIDNENRATVLQRDAMRAFYTGGYQESLTLVSQIERTGILSARTQFYRACSLAALAATSTNPSQDKRLADAKRYLAEAAKSAAEYREDLRYISPKVKQLLGI